MNLLEASKEQYSWTEHRKENIFFFVNSHKNIKLNARHELYPCKTCFPVFLWHIYGPLMKKECHRCYKIFLYSIQDVHVKKLKTISSIHYITPAMEFAVPKLNLFDNCNDIACDLKVSMNCVTPSDEQFILVVKSFQEIRQNLTHIPFIKGVEKNL